MWGENKVTKWGEVGGKLEESDKNKVTKREEDTWSGNDGAIREGDEFK